MWSFASTSPMGFMACNGDIFSLSLPYPFHSIAYSRTFVNIFTLFLPSAMAASVWSLASTSLMGLIHNDPRQHTWELANVINCDHSTIARHLHSMDKVQKLGVWVPHALRQNNKNQRVAVCAYLLACHRLDREHYWQFLSCIVTGDEKWCLYGNISKRKELLNQNKRIICRKYSNFSIWHFIF